MQATRDLGAHSAHLTPVEQMPGWSQLTITDEQGTTTKLALRHDDCGTMQAHVDQADNGDELYTCLSCAAMKADAPE